MINDRDIHEYLLNRGVKPSVQRIAIMRYLKTHFTHPTADEIYTALSPSMPTLSKTTVYNTLRLLADHRAILSLDIDGKNTHYDGDASAHAHFRCRCCGTIYDLPLVEAAGRFIVADPGTVIDEIQVYGKGICRNCYETSKLTEI